MKTIDIEEVGGMQREVTIPAIADLAWVSKYLGISKPTINSYRRLAYEWIAEYEILSNQVYPNYLQDCLNAERKKARGQKVREVFPDKPPFVRGQIEILEGINYLFKRWKKGHLVVCQLRHQPKCWMDYKIHQRMVG